MFNSTVRAPDAGFQPPHPGFGKANPPEGKVHMAHHRQSPMVPSPPMAGPGPVRHLPGTPPIPSVPSRPVTFPRPPAVRPGPQPAEVKVKQMGALLQNLMLRPPGPKAQLAGPNPIPSPAPGPAAAPSPTARQQPRQRTSADVTPLRRPLPPDGALPLKPRRPPVVNLRPFLRFKRGYSLPDQRQRDDSPLPSDRSQSLPAVISPPQLPQRNTKPRLPRQAASIDMDSSLTYDDVGSLENNESWSDSSPCMDGDTEDIYEFIDEDQESDQEANQEPPGRKKQKGALKQQQQGKKDQMERQRKENEYKKIFQLQGEVEVLHTTRVLHDWHGEGKLDLTVRQDESVEILRVKNNPGGKWLARSMTGNYGYISNTCVDISYEAVKRAILQRRIDPSQLPPPPPDPPHMSNMESSNRHSAKEDEDDYDDIQQFSEDFPPPPPDSRKLPNVEKELKKKFKYDGPLRVLHTMMVDPNGMIKKPRGKDLPVTRGEIVDVIQFSNSKKALCCNQFGQYGYVSQSLLLPMEGDIYDDIDNMTDIYDNDSQVN